MNQIELLRERVSLLSAKDREFANSLLSSADRGRASDKQMYWIEKLAERAVAPAPVAPAPVKVAYSLDGLRALFQRAKDSRLKNPSLLLMVEGLPMLQVKPRPSGDIIVAEQVWGGRFFGSVKPDGVFVPSFREAASQAVIADALARLAADPAGVAGAFGKKSGQCCFCSLPLSDEGSLEVGYGPVCAKKWGLPHKAGPVSRGKKAEPIIVHAPPLHPAVEAYRDGLNDEEFQRIGGRSIRL